LSAKWEACRQLVHFIQAEIEEGQDLPEELWLFSALASKAQITAGGPMCMLYFGMHLASHPFERVSKFTGKVFRPTAKSVSAHLRDFFEQNSHVCIPIGDHLACRHLREHMQSILVSEKSEAAFNEFAETVRIYFEIRKQHFEKEDNCLLPMTMALLSTDELDRLGEEMSRAQAGK
jgi:hypothetical protein